MRIPLRSLLYQLHHLHSFEYVQYYHVSGRSGEVWVSLGGDANSVPSDTAAAHYNDWPVVNAGAVPEAFTGPRWTGDGQEYLAFGIDLRKAHHDLPNVIEAWPFSSFDVPEEFMDPSLQGRIWPEVARKVRRDLRRALEMLEFLDRRGGPPTGNLDRTYTGDDLYQADSQVAVLHGLREARRVMDERLSAIRYALCRTKNATKTYLERRYASYFDAWHLREEYRGAYLDHRHLEPDVAHVLDLIDKEVPVYFTLEPDYVPRLSPEETRIVEQINSGEIYSRAFEEASPWVDEDLSLPSPTKTFGLSIEDRANLPAPAPTRMLRLTDLCRYAHSILGDVLHNSTSPPNSPMIVPMLNIVPDALLVVEPLSEVRLMLWAIEGRSSDAAAVLGEALLRGWSFRVLYPEAHLERLKELRVGSPSPTLPGLQPLSPVTDTGVIQVQKEWTRFLERVLILLSRPHAKAFLLLGGLFWRLAILFGQPFLADWMVDLLGPSTTLVSARPSRSSSQTIRGFYDDQVSETEKELLQGLVVSKTTGQKYFWFPPWELLVKHRYHDGEWSATEERLLMERYHSLQRGETSCRPLTYEEWDLELRTNSLGRLQRDSFVAPDIQGVRSFLVEVQSELGGSWNEATLATVSSSINVEDPEWWD